MSHSSIDSFERRAACPEPQQLLALEDATLSYLMRERIAEHLAACDFCGATLHLLKAHPAASVVFTPSRAPLHVLLLAQSLLPGASCRNRRREKHAA